VYVRGCKITATTAATAERDQKSRANFLQGTDMKSVAFESKRPVPKVDFVSPEPPENSSAHGQLREVSKSGIGFLSAKDKILSGRTSRSREIRREIVRKEIEGGVTISAIARRFRVTRQSVHQQLCELRNLTGFHRQKRT
jgi:hypothetical protein